MQRMELLDLTNAGGAQTFTLGENNIYKKHQLQIEVSSQPSAGTLAIAIKTPGASVNSTLDSSVDMTVLTATNAKIIDIDAMAETITITPSSFDVDKTYNLYLTSI